MTRMRRCKEPGCTALCLPDARGCARRCVKCAAYHRGRMKAQEKRRKKRYRLINAHDPTDGREALLLGRTRYLPKGESRGEL